MSNDLLFAVQTGPRCQAGFRCMSSRTSLISEKRIVLCDIFTPSSLLVLAVLKNDRQCI